MTDEELVSQLKEMITNKTHNAEVHVIPYLIPIIKTYAQEYAEEIIKNALHTKYEAN